MHTQYNSSPSQQYYWRVPKWHATYTKKGKRDCIKGPSKRTPHTQVFRFYWTAIYRGLFHTPRPEATFHECIGVWVRSTCGKEDILYMKIGCEFHPVDKWPHTQAANHWCSNSKVRKASAQATRLAAKAIIAHMGA